MSRRTPLGKRGRATFACVALLVAACGGHGPPTASAPPPSPRASSPPLPDPTLGICAKVDARVSGNGALLAAAEDAAARGCPRESLAYVAKVASPTNEEHARAVLVAAEAREDALTEGFERTAPVRGKPEAWMTPNGKDDEDAVTFVRGAIADGVLPKSVHESGRFARLAVRDMGTCPCDATLSARTCDALRDVSEKRLKEVLDGAGLVGGEDPNPHRPLEVGHLMLQLCQLKEAHAELKEAMDGFADAGDALSSGDAFIDVMQVVFPGGRASDFAAVSEEPGDAVARARLEEAAASGVGDYAERGDAVEKALGEALPANPAWASSPALRARALWVRAVAKLRLRQDPEAALALATQAKEEAVRARRADLLDASRVVELFADLALHRDRDAEGVVAAIGRSLDARGAVGARERITDIAGIIAHHEELRGRDGIATSLAVLPLADGLAPLSRVSVRAGVAESLGAAGRFEEALEVLREARRELEGVKPTEPQEQNAVAILRDTLADGERNMRTALGDLAAIEPDPALAAAVDRGDAAAWLRASRTPLEGNEAFYRTYAQVTQGFCTVPSAEEVRRMAAAMIAHVATVRSTETQANADAESLRERTTSVVTKRFGPVAALAVAACAVQLGDATMMQVARGLFQATADLGGAPDPVQVAWLGALRAELAGSYADAARAYLDIGREWLSRGGLSAAGGLGQAQRAAPFFAMAARASMKAGDMAAAFAALEESSSRDLRAARVMAAKATGGGATEDVVAVERKIAALQARERALVLLVAGSDDAAVKDALRKSRDAVAAEVTRLEAERDAKARAVASLSPAAYRGAALGPPPTLDETRRRLADDEALVYFVYAGVEDAWALVVRKGGAHAVKLRAVDAAGAPTLDLSVSRLARAIDRRTAAGRGLVLDTRTPGGAPPDDDGVTAASTDLYASLIAPIEPLVPVGTRVLLVPGALLTSIPVAALGGDAPWVLRNPLRVLPGAFMLEDAAVARASARSPLVVGSPDFGDVRARQEAASRGVAASGLWVDLPGTRTEAAAVAKLYGAAPVMGKAATEERVKAGLGGASIVHFATHGLADVKRPEYSAVILAAPEGGSTEDGILHAYEIEHLRTSADLVVLSACETGRGQGRGSEGTLALDRAFLVAGAGAVVSSLWVVDDESTAALMTAFHQGLREGKPADVSLAAAMRDVRSKSEWKSFYYWAGFRVVGAGR